MSEATQKDQALGQTTLETSDFSALLNKEFKPQTDRMRQDVESAVNVLARQALESTAVVSNDAIESIQSIIAELDTQAQRADQPDPASRGVPEARGRLARPALPGEQHGDGRRCSRFVS